MSENIFNIFKYEELLKTVWVYPTISNVDDPYEKTSKDVYLNPVPVKAIVHQLGMGALKWKYWGNLPTGSIQVITKKNYYNLFLNAGKIVYNNEEYYVYKDDSRRFSIVKKEDYILIILEKKNK